MDDQGRLWAAAMDVGVHCYTPDGTLIRRLITPEPVANITVGGPKRNRMFRTADTNVYSAVLSATGLPRTPPRGH